ncbi:Na+/H+ antiporter subunit E [Clostridium sp. D2Q-11]|uniref:Na+/H+ antiporter subunit E n=1 Tax=Anaeromonas frigoriresistens TaxID=2683708 RepID=A0A942Z8K3_9FIRM|nr:Na+/H+ antiporter subunit E [Anaeromonas frigoriresistens]MBS4538358.1 Na+/H+ antiporter subunit E [Anaeromonas frigoriresistens]
MIGKRFHIKTFLILYGFWFLLTMNTNPSNIVGGLIVSLLVTYSSYGILYDEKGFVFEFPTFFVVFKYIMILFIEIYKASFELIKTIINNEYSPSIVEVNLELEDPLLITIVANSITLTPGTITVEKKGSKLLVLYIKEDRNNEVENNIKSTFESIFLRKEDNSDIS